MKRYCFTEQLIDLEGDKLFLMDDGRLSTDAEQDGEENKALTLARVCTSALANERPPGEDGKEAKPLSGDHKMDAWDLAMRIRQRPDSCPLEGKELTMLKKAISDSWPTALISGQAWQMLKPIESEDDEDDEKAAEEDGDDNEE